MKALVAECNFKNIDDIQLAVIECQTPKLKVGTCLVKVIASGINQSDGLALLGYFKHSTLPRIIGRDFSGVIVDGDQKLLGKYVWGSGGAAGIDFDGAQCEYITLVEDALAEIPEYIDPTVASAQPLPYLTAYYGLVTRANINSGNTVLITGALGQVGMAAMYICKWQNCQPIALVRGNSAVVEAQKLGWVALDSNDNDWTSKLVALNNGKKVEVIFNSLGNTLWSELLVTLAEFGKIVTIAARDGAREVTLNLFELYRNNQEVIGINSVSLDFVANARLLNQMKDGFNSGMLKPLKVLPECIFSMDAASDAYKMVLNSTNDGRVVIKI